jgi:hypothetical protein
MSRRSGPSARPASEVHVRGLAAIPAVAGWAPGRRTPVRRGIAPRSVAGPGGFRSARGAYPRGAALFEPIAGELPDRAPPRSGLAQRDTLRRMSIVSTEMERAEQLLRSLVGSTIDTITINSLDTEDAPFLALIVSKLSPIIGNLLERRIIELLTQEDADGMRWVRQDPDFPDALLMNADGTSANSGYEVKAWYTLSTELTGRFRESVNLLEPRDVRVVIIAWHMSHIVYGTPQVVGVLTVDAESVARKRDSKYHNPPDYLCVEPQDTTARTRNLQQTNVAGYKWQGRPDQVAKAEEIVSQNAAHGMAAHTAAAQELASELMSRFPYRLDTNFAKVDRIDHPDIERFKAEVLGMQARDRTMSQWIRLLRALNKPRSDDELAKAAAEIQRVYEAL